MLTDKSILWTWTTFFRYFIRQWKRAFVRLGALVTMCQWNVCWSTQRSIVLRIAFLSYIDACFISVYNIANVTANIFAHAKLALSKLALSAFVFFAFGPCVWFIHSLIHSFIHSCNEGAARWWGSSGDMCVRSVEKVVAQVFVYLQFCIPYLVS